MTLKQAAIVFGLLMLVVWCIAVPLLSMLGVVHEDLVWSPLVIAMTAAMFAPFIWVFD